MSIERLSHLYLVLATYTNNGSQPIQCHLILDTKNPVQPATFEEVIRLLIPPYPTQFRELFKQTMDGSIIEFPSYHYLRFKREPDQIGSQIRLTTSGEGQLYFIHHGSFLYLLEHQSNYSNSELERLIISSITQESGNFDHRLQETIKKLCHKHQFRPTVYRRVEKTTS